MKNYIYNVIYQIIQILAPVIVAPYISRIFEADGVGLISAINAVTLNFILFAVLGTSTFGTKYIGEVNNSKQNRSTRFWEVFIFRVTSTAIVILIFVIYVSLAFREWKNYYYIYLTLIINVIFDITWFFQGVENFKVIVARNIVIKAIYVIGTFLFVKVKQDIGLYMVIYCSSTLIGSLSMWFTLPKYIEKVSFDCLKPFKRVREIISLFIPTIAIQIYTVLDKVMLLMFTTNTFENGFYEQSEKIVKMSMTVITSLSVVMLPRNAHSYASNDESYIKKQMVTVFRFVWMIGLPLTTGLIVCSDYLIPVYLGVGYEKSIVLMRLLSILVLIIGLSNAITVQFLIPTNRVKIYTKAAIMAACCNMIINLIFIPSYLSIGASVGTIIAESVGLAYELYYLIYHQLFVFTDFIQGISNYLIATMVMIVGLIVLKNNIALSAVSLLLLIGAGVLLYFTVLIILKDTMILKLGRSRK